MKRTRADAGFTMIELMVLLAVLAILFGMGMPAFQSLRHAGAFHSAEQEVIEVLHRARWSAITSGRPATTVELSSPTVIAIRDGGTVLSSIDVSEYGVTITASAAAFDFDSRGLIAGAAPSFTVTNPRISASRQVTLNSLGKVEAS